MLEGGAQLRRGPGKLVKIIVECSQEIHTRATRPLYLVCFVIDTTAFPPHNPPSLLLWAHCVRWGKHDAIFAGLDGAVHQPRMFRARALVAGPSLRPECGPGVLS